MTINSIADLKDKEVLAFQILVGDGNIFKYYSKQISDKADTTQEVVYHPIFEKTDYNAAFHNEQIMKDFNEGLKEIKANGVYDKLLSNYIK